MANDTVLALDAAVYTSDYDQARAFADAVDAGTVRINGPPSHGIGDVPYGGRVSDGKESTLPLSRCYGPRRLSSDGSRWHSQT